MATVAVIDFGSQYTQLIARRVREQNVHSLIFPPNVSPRELADLELAGIILSGGPASAYAEDGPTCDPEILELGVPVLAVCYGMQLVCRMLGGDVRAQTLREYGRVQLDVLHNDPLFTHVPGRINVWMSHGDAVTTVSSAFKPIGRTRTCPIAAVRHADRPIYGLQFHPEVAHTPNGGQIIRNFLTDICHAKQDWSMGNVASGAIDAVRARVADDERVICGLSGGVDSSVTAALIHRAIGPRLVCIFVDNGLMRRGEIELVENTFRKHFAIDLRVVRAAERFLAALEGVTDPQEKRRIIGREFIEVFKDEALTVPNARFLAQGTLYPDVIESGHGAGGVSANIKLHHNVGGLPAELGFELIEPLRDLFKDEVRRIGEHLDLPKEIIWRHPFPGPGLAVRIMGAITAERLEILRAVDEIVIEEIRAAGWYDKIGQAFAVLLPVSTVGVMGDARSYGAQHVAAVRFVETTDFMTADWVRVDFQLLERISSRVINEVAGVNRVVYDVSSKPPATIEWE
ncbi:MAG TPA: glutamine-hydrolyzing GMP synthase [Phycisphaerae bacterium]|nr:glutamine-hydrolyzing GMP synthase [Phycisphaerae bacterium]